MLGSEPWLVQLGDHVTVAAGVRFITHDGGVWVFRHEFPDLDVFGAITVGDNVFIGINAILLPGTVVGSNVVIGAGSVVRGRIPDNSVVAGVPARVVRSLDQYRANCLGKGVHVRHMSGDAKRAAITEILDQREASRGTTMRTP